MSSRVDCFGVTGWDVRWEVKRAKPINHNVIEHLDWNKQAV